jgi:hypothetical protein
VWKADGRQVAIGPAALMLLRFNMKDVQRDEDDGSDGKR